jgi:hypothetical protein
MPGDAVRLARFRIGGGQPGRAWPRSLSTVSPPPRIRACHTIVLWLNRMPPKGCHLHRPLSCNLPG